MTESKVVIEDSCILTPFGDLDSTTKNLLNCNGAIKKLHLFNLNIPFAAFTDPGKRLLNNSVSVLSDTLDKKLLDKESTLLIYAAAKGDLSGLEASFQNKDDILASLTSPLLDEQAIQIAEYFNISKSNIMVISNACASGQVALETAKELLEDGSFKKILVVGFDALFNFTVSGFNSLGALSHSNGARPFDKDRDGLTMGECAGAAILSFRKPKNGDVVISGAGSSNDANHRTGPSRTGDGLFKAIKSALSDASIKSHEVAAIKCHGTSTNYNDAMEAKALYSTFGETCPPAASLKGALGHMSGGGSLVEVLIGASILNKRELPPTIGFETKGVDEPITLSNKCQKIIGNTLLCLAAGFGGLNSALILEQV